MSENERVEITPHSFLLNGEFWTQGGGYEAAKELYDALVESRGKVTRLLKTQKDADERASSMAKSADEYQMLLRESNKSLTESREEATRLKQAITLIFETVSQHGPTCLYLSDMEEACDLLGVEIQPIRERGGEGYKEQAG